MIPAKIFIPKLIGSWFKVQACPGATGCGYVNIFSVYDFFAFHHRILTYQVWARGSKVITDCTNEFFSSSPGLVTITHWVRRRWRRNNDQNPLTNAV